MARGAEAKLRRRNRKKEDAAAVDEHFGADDDDDSPKVKTVSNGKGAASSDDSIPLPPGMLMMDLGTDAPVDKGSDTDDDAKVVTPDAMSMPKKKKKSRSAGEKGSKAVAQQPVKAKEGIKMLPLIFLILMTATTLIPGLIFASDYVGAWASKTSVLGRIGFTLGIGPVPKKRVLSFYEKHDPNKLEDVTTLLSKHYGDYPKLLKRLERKYQDYGYFLGWEEDEAAVKLAMEQLQATYDMWLQNYWNRYAPQPMKTAVRNIRYNITFLVQRGRKIWKKHVWPMLEPFLGVPDGAAKQKRQDAADARKSRPGAKAGTKRKNKDFRDDEE
jgi:hypothetical protein